MKQGWEIKKLGEICSVFEDGDWIESKDQSPEGVRLIQTGNVGAGFFKDRGEKAKYISEDTFKKLRCTEIVEDDCLISRLPDPVGRACVVPNTGEKMITAVDCTIIRFEQKAILSEWFVFYSLSKEYQSQINLQVSGATRQRISRKNLGLINIPLPLCVNIPETPTHALIREHFRRQAHDRHNCTIYFSGRAAERGG
ncbi:MAG: restriction endonuclease subunit S, partial [Methylococcales bacterium]|nr:restriction endonuclease subunit S [Methylococcales bacterium]